MCCRRRQKSKKIVANTQQNIDFNSKYMNLRSNMNRYIMLTTFTTLILLVVLSPSSIHGSSIPIHRYAAVTKKFQPVNYIESIKFQNPDCPKSIEFTNRRCEGRCDTSSSLVGKSLSSCYGCEVASSGNITIIMRCNNKNIYTSVEMVIGCKCKSLKC